MITVGLSLNGEPQENVEVLRLTTTNEVSGLYRAEAELIVQDGARLQREALVGQALALSIRLDESDARPTIAGLIRAAEQDHDADNGTTIVRLTVTPRFTGLGSEERCATYAGMTPAEIIAAVLARNDLQAGRDFEIRLEDESVYFPIDFVAQFDESDLDFVRRIAEYWGIAYALEPGTDDLGLLVFSDQPQAFRAIRGTELPYVASGHRHGVTHLKRSVNELPREVMLQNYDPARPQDTLVVTCPVPAGTTGRLVEHDHNFGSTDKDGQLLARLRAEELSSRRIVFTGEGASVTLRAGGLCTLTGHPVWGDLQLFLTRVVSTFENTPLMQGPGTLPAATQRFEALPLVSEGVPLRFRPRRRAEKPRIHGVIHGIVEEHEDRLNPVIDDTGCYRVRLLAHGSDEGKGRAVYPHVRMAQPVGGAGAGMHFPLHPGTEVLLSFVDGDPDRPVICGAVPNLRDRSVVERDEAGANVIRTAAGSRLEIDDGALALSQASNAVTSTDMRCQVSVPYDESRLGSYLRLGREDAAEPQEARGPGSEYAMDGWFDFTNGARTSITMGDTEQLFGGTRTTRSYGTVSDIRFYGGALAPLARDASDADNEFESRREAANVSASFDTEDGIAHSVGITAGGRSNYTAGYSASFTLGPRFITNLGTAVIQNIALSYSNTIGVSVGFSSSYSVSFGFGSSISASDAASWGTSSTSSTTASQMIELSLRNPAATMAAAAAHKRLKVATTALATLNVGVETSYSTILTLASAAGQNFDSEAVIEGDQAATTIRFVGFLAAIISAVAVAAVFVKAAKKAMADATGTGPAVVLDADAAKITCGPRVGAGDPLVTGRFGMDSIQLSAGPPVLGGVVSIAPTAITMTLGLSFIRISPDKVEIAGGAGGLTVGPAGVTVTGLLTATVAPPPPPPPPIVRKPDVPPALRLIADVVKGG